MSVNFSRRGIEDNTWSPNVCGVDFTERLMKTLGACAVQGIEVWTAWVEILEDASGPGYTEQVTPENCQVVISDLDDDSDAVLLLDRRDGMWFRFNRLNHADIFNGVASTVAPWAQRFSSLIPTQAGYKSVLDQLGRDIGEGDLTLPDGWD